MDFTEARDSEWQWHQLGHMQVCTLLQTDNRTSTPPLSFYRPDALPAAHPTASKHWRQLEPKESLGIIEVCSYRPFLWPANNIWALKGTHSIDTSHKNAHRISSFLYTPNPPDDFWWKGHSTLYASIPIMQSWWSEISVLSLVFLFFLQTWW